MKKGFTLAEVLIVVMIMGILASFAIPVVQDFITRSKLREIVSMVELVRAAAKYYDGRDGLENLVANQTNQLEVRQNLKLSLPPETLLNCEYLILTAGNGTDRNLMVYYPKSGGSLIYEYILPDGDSNGNGTIIDNSGYAHYLRGIRGLP